MRNEYFLPGVAAVVLTIIFAIYWSLEIYSVFADGWNSYKNKISDFSFLDLMFISIGLISIYIFYQFKSALNERSNFKSIDVLIWLLMAMSTLFHLGTVIFGLVFEVGTAELFSLTRVEDISLAVFIGICFVIFGVIDIILGIILIRYHEKLPKILVVLGIISILQGIFEVSIVQAQMVVITFPVYLILVAIYFFKEPEVVEVV